MTKVIDKLIWLAERITILLLASSIVIIAMQVFSRYVLRSPFGWTEQTARYMFIWIVMLGIPIAFRRNLMIAFDMLLIKLPIIVQRIINVVSMILIDTFCVYYFVQGITLVLKGGHKLAAGIAIPLKYIYMAQPVGAALLFIVAVELTVKAFKVFKQEGGKN